MAVDSLWSSVVLFMPMDGTDGSTSAVIDVKGHTATLVGNTQIKTAQYLTGGSSCYFDGAGDRITFPASSDWDFSGGNGSIEFAVRPDVLSTGTDWCRLFLIGANGSTSALTCQWNNSGAMQFGVPGYTMVAAANGTIATGSWQRFEMSLSGGSARIFKDGALVAGPTTITAQASSSSNQLYIGYDTVGTVNFNYQGYLDRVRFTKGTARHTSAFTSDDNPFPRPTITGTVYDSAGAKAAKVVVAQKRSTLAMAGQTVSDGSTGIYTIYPADFSEHIVTRFDTATYPLVDGGSGENAIIYDRVIPG